jgi:MFS family permease
MLFAVLQTVSGLMPTFATYALVLPLLGLSVLTVITSANALVQLTSAPEMRGRVASIFLMLAIGSVPLTAPIVGWLGEEFGARAALVSTGVATGLGIGLAALWFLRQRGDFELRDGGHYLAWSHARRAHVHGVPTA